MGNDDDDAETYYEPGSLAAPEPVWDPTAPPIWEVLAAEGEELLRNDPHVFDDCASSIHAGEPWPGPVTLAKLIAPLLTHLHFWGTDWYENFNFDDCLKADHIPGCRGGSHGIRIACVRCITEEKVSQAKWIAERL